MSDIAYVANGGDLVAVNLTSDTVTKEFPVVNSSDPSSSVAVAPDGQTAYVANGGELVAVNLTSDTVTKEFPVVNSSDPTSSVAVAPQ